MASGPVANADSWPAAGRPIHRNRAFCPQAPTLAQPSATPLPALNRVYATCIHGQLHTCSGPGHAPPALLSSESSADGQATASIWRSRGQLGRREHRSYRIHKRKTATTWSPLTESNRRPSPYHRQPAGPCNRRRSSEQARHWLTRAVASYGERSLAGFCPPICPQHDLRSPRLSLSLWPVLAGEPSDIIAWLEEVASSAPPVAARALDQVYGTGADRLVPFADMLAVHELAHVFYDGVPFVFPRSWLMELFANMALYAFVVALSDEQLAGVLGGRSTRWRASGWHRGTNCTERARLVVRVFEYVSRARRTKRRAILFARNDLPKGLAYPSHPFYQGISKSGSPCEAGTVKGSRPPVTKFYQGIYEAAKNTRLAGQGSRPRARPARSYYILAAYMASGT